MNSVYAMQRANGEWFALKERGLFRVPVFASNSEAVNARAFNIEMLVFKAVPLDERALKDFAPNSGQPDVSFWLVDKESRSMKRGVLLTYPQLAMMIRGGEESGLETGRQ